MFTNGMRPVHPGEILREEYLEPLNMSANALSRALSITATRVNEIVKEQRGITSDTALRLAAYFGGDAQTWLNLQLTYDLKIAEQKVGDTIRNAISPFSEEVWLKTHSKKSTKSSSESLCA